MPPGQTGWLPRLRDAWGRYPAGVPLAVTEAHIGCTEDEQVRWLVECWRAVDALRAEGADLRAVTVWTLFGAVDRCGPLTRRTGRYEPGAFDVGVPGSGATPRPAPLAEAAVALAREGDFDHPLLQTPGWWERGGRVAPNSGARAEAIGAAGAGRPALPVAAGRAGALMP